MYLQFNKYIWPLRGLFQVWKQKKILDENQKPNIMYKHLAVP